MLVLSRKVGDKIRISDNIIVTVLKCQGSTVRIGIEAPVEVKVLRAELPPLPAASESVAVPNVNRSALRIVTPAAHRQRFAAAGSKASPQASAAAESISTTESKRVGTSHPQRWTVASMRERAQSAAASRHTPKPSNER